MCLYVILYSNWCSKDFLNLWINIFQHLILFSVLISPYRASGMCLLLLLRFQIDIGQPTLIYPFQISSLFSILLSLHALSRMLSSGQFSSSLSLSSTRSYDNIRSCTWQYLTISIWYLIFSLSTLYLYLNFKGCLLYSSTILSIVTPPPCILVSGCADCGCGQRFSVVLPSFLCPGSQGHPWLALTSRTWGKWCCVNSEPAPSHVPPSCRKPSSHRESNLIRLMKDEGPCGERPRHVSTSTDLVLLERVPDMKEGPAEDKWVWLGPGKLPPEVILTCGAK